jgi:cysteine synthase A
VLAKLEWANPTGSMKDRMALAVIEGAEGAGLLGPGDTVVEYTAGTTGISLAFVCAAKGYRFHAISSDAFSVEKRRTMEAFGAVVQDEPSDRRRITAQTATPSAATTRSATRSGSSRDSTSTRSSRRSRRHTASTARRTRSARSTQHAALEVVAVEPAESPVLSGGESGAHQIEGIGIGFVPPLWEPDNVGAIEQVSTEEAVAMCRRLAREEAVFAGTSSGANVVAALRVAERLGAGAVVVTVIVDSGLRYLTTDLYRD